MDIIMPKMGESVNEGTIIKWHKKVGDAVKRDEIIFEISTDKVDTEIPSPADGVVSEIKYNEGDTVAVGTVVAVINDGGVNAIVKETHAETSKPDIQQVQYEEIAVKAEKEKPSYEEKKNQSTEHAGELLSIQMPKMGESVMEGTIIKWHKKVGDKIKKDETIFEISTDKVDTEVPSPAEGILAEVLVAEQETVEVGTVVAKLSTGASPQIVKEKSNHVIEEKIQHAASTEKVEEPVSMHDNFSSAKLTSEEAAGDVNSFLSPLVLNIARKENVSFDEIAQIKGSGLDGRVSKKDILSYIENRAKAKTALPQEKKEPTKIITEENVAPAYNYSSVQQTFSSNEVEIIPMDNIRQKIMQHMVNSRDTSVHVSAMLEVDMSKIYNFIQRNRDEFLKKENIKLTYMPFVARACVKGLQQFPLINASIEGSSIVRKKFINLGIAVAVEPTGLIVPNIKAANEKSLIGLARSINDIAVRARTKKLTPDDITNGTFTITNYGVFGTIFGTPIINQPEVAILGVGTVVKKPVVIEVDGADTIAIKPVMALTLSHDHRLVDGMLGGKFLKFLKDSLENFDSSEI